MEQRNARNRVFRGFERQRLEGRVGNMIRIDRGCALHLYESPAFSVPSQDVRTRDESRVAYYGGLEDDVDIGLQHESSSLRGRRIDVRGFDGFTGRITRPRQLIDAVAKKQPAPRD